MPSRVRRSYGGVISGSGNVTMAGTGMLTLIGANTFTGGATVSAGTLQLGDGINNGSLSTTGGVTNNSALVFNVSNGGQQTYNGSISGMGNLMQVGGGTLNLGGANSFSGTTMVTGGTLNVANSDALQASTVIAPTTGGISFAGNSFAFGALGGSGNLSLQNTAGSAIALTLGLGTAPTRPILASSARLVDRDEGGQRHFDPRQRQYLHRSDDHCRRDASAWRRQRQRWLTL